MLRSYLLTAWRSIARNRVSSIVSVVGLALGVSSSLLVFLVVQHETSFDRFHAKADRLYRLLVNVEHAGGTMEQLATIPAEATALIRERYPEVRDSTRVSMRRALAAGDAGVADRPLVAYYVDPGFFSMFSFPAASGTEDLRRPDVVVLTPAAAERLFGQQEPVGRTLSLEDQVSGARHLVQVAAVLAPIPSTSHLRPEIVAPQALLEAMEGRMNVAPIYVELDDPASAPALAEKLAGDGALLRAILPEGVQPGTRASYVLQPLTEIYLHSNVHFGEEHGDLTLLVVYGCLAGLILAAACLNVSSLFTARVAARAREIGVHKVAGADRRDIVLQLLSETLILALLALALAMAVAEVAVGPFATLVGSAVSLEPLRNPLLLAASAALVLLAACLSGVIPALLYSRLDPVACLRARRPRSSRRLRRILVGAQVTVSASLFATAVTVGGDLRFLASRDLGFRTQGVSILSVDSRSVRSRYQSLKQELLRVPGVESVAASSGAIFQGLILRTPARSDALSDERTFAVLFAEPDFIEVYGIPLLEGAVPAPASSAALNGASVLVNRSAALLAEGGMLGRTLEAEIIGDPFGGSEETRSDRRHVFTVAGIVGDFAFASPIGPVGPMVIIPTERAMWSVSVRTDPTRGEQALAGVRAVWERLFPELPYRSRSAELMVQAAFSGYRDFEALLWIATGMAVLVSLLGLYPLAAYEAEQRTKEIGIRKAMGAGSLRICLTLLTAFVPPVLGADLVALPVAALAQRVLYRFAEYGYPFHFRLATAALTVAYTVTVAVLAAFPRIVAAAARDPVRSLRYE